MWHKSQKLKIIKRITTIIAATATTIDASAQTKTNGGSANTG